MSNVDNSDSLKVFLCHGSEDKEIIRSLYFKLKQDGFNPWLDEKDILAGKDWNEEIKKAVKTSDIILVCLSQATVGKTGYIQKEIRIALDAADERPFGTIFIIPVKLDDCIIPERLSQWQYVQYSDGEGYTLILKSLTSYKQSTNISHKKSTIKFPRPQRLSSYNAPTNYNYSVLLDHRTVLEYDKSTQSDILELKITPGKHFIQVEYNVLFPGKASDGRVSIVGKPGGEARGKTAIKDIDFKTWNLYN